MLKHLTLPMTRLECSSLCLGTANMGSSLPREASFRMLDAFYENGGNFLDSARVYADWIPGGSSASETTIGLWMKERNLRDKIVVATKGGHPPLNDMSRSRISRKEVALDIHASLRCLRSDTIDLYYLHRDDPSVPVGEILEFMNEFTGEGKIRFFGCSNWDAGRISSAAEFARINRFQGFSAVQNMWSLAEPDLDRASDKSMRSMDDGMIKACKDYRISAIPYSSQARGFFTKHAAAGESKYDPSRKGLYETELNYSRLKTAMRLAEKHGVGVTAVVLAYLRCQPMTVVPVIGPGNLEQLHDCLLGTELVLSGSELEELANGNSILDARYWKFCPVNRRLV